MTNECFDSTQIYNWQQRIKIKRIGTSMIATLLFFIENIYNHYILLLTQWYTNLCHLTEFIPRLVLVPEIVIPLPCSDGLLRHILLFVYFSVQRTHSFRWFPWQMQHQHFQCFDFYRHYPGRRLFSQVIIIDTEGLRSLTMVSTVELNIDRIHSGLTNLSDVIQFLQLNQAKTAVHLV